MNLILRAHVAAAARDVVPIWPVNSFIAVNPLSGQESLPFDSATVPGVSLTRSLDSYVKDFGDGRITDADLEAALAERAPELTGNVIIGGVTVSALRVAIVDMLTAQWRPDASRESTDPWLDDYLSTWIALYLNPDSLWTMPHRQHGFYTAWRTLARRDPSLPRSVRRAIVDTPTESDLALASALEQLGIDPKDATGEMRRELRHLSGWVGHIKWRAEKIGDIDLVSYLAVRFTLMALQGIRPAGTSSDSVADDDLGEAVWRRAERVTAELAGVGRSAREGSHHDTATVARVLAGHPVSAHPFTWQKAYELHYRAALLPSLKNVSTTVERPWAQVMMCIDTRSEGMRRHLEADNGVETFGFAGFFGVPVRFSRFRARGAVDSLPALLSARHRLTEIPLDESAARRHVARARARDSLRQAEHSADSRTMTPFALAEGAGWLFGARSILRTFAPALHARLQRAIASPRDMPTTVTIADAFTLDERATMAETAIRMTGMTSFAPVVLMAGHASESANNLYQSALDCGACGGNPGAANARAAAAIFNDPDVRTLLESQGIHIPADSFFIAAEHNTVSDTITLLDPHLVPASHEKLVRRFDHVRLTAADALLSERAKDLPGASHRHRLARLRERAYDWAEVYPELGLAGNAAMIIGPRQMTRAVDLARRVFLHSYDHTIDLDGTGLETIMTAPLVVAQWINHQYFFSTLNPTTLGAGSKTIHNAIGTIGVLSGHRGDLRRGLPWQSVGLGDILLHEPMRLAVIIQAPLARIGDIVSRNLVLRNLLDNDWITLTARPQADSAWHRYTRYGWVPTGPTTEGA